MTVQGFGTGGFGVVPYGSAPPSFGLAGATPIDATHVEVFYSVPVDQSYSPVLSPTSYTIPGLTVLAVSLTGTYGVTLTTTGQQSVQYTVTVLLARDIFGSSIDPSLNTANFTGISSTSSYFAVATGPKRVRAVFVGPMLNDSNLSNPASYTITGLNGTNVSVTSATPEQASNPVSVILTLLTSLTEDNSYVCAVSSNVHNATGFNVVPPTSVFSWSQPTANFQIPFRMFTGEVSGGLLGSPDGLVYFSPALNTPVPESIIQVEDVDVCTTAFDTYTPPSPVDPPTLYTWTSQNPTTYGLNQAVCWAPFPRNFEAKIELGFTGATNQDTFGAAQDTSCTIEVQQQFGLGYVALLNDTAWTIFDHMHGTSTPPTFITAKNLAPIPAGPKTQIVLRTQISGKSSFTATTPKKIGHMTLSLAGRAYLEAGLGPPDVVLAHAGMSGASGFSARTNQRFGGVVNLKGLANMTANASEGGSIPNVLFGSASVVPRASVRRAAASTLVGAASFHVTGSVRRGGTAVLPGSGVTTGTLEAHWAGHDQVQGSSSVLGGGVVVHKAEAFLLGGGSVSARSS